MIAVRMSCGDIYLNYPLTKLMKLNVGDKIRLGYDAICRDILGEAKKTKRFEYKEFKDGRKRLVITSNLSPAQISEQYSDRMTDRLREMVEWIDMGVGSRR